MHSISARIHTDYLHNPTTELQEHLIMKTFFRSETVAPMYVEIQGIQL